VFYRKGLIERTGATPIEPNWSWRWRTWPSGLAHPQGRAIDSMPGQVDGCATGPRESLPAPLHFAQYGAGKSPEKIVQGAVARPYRETWWRNMVAKHYIFTAESVKALGFSRSDYHV
jgi:hypothetical protein